MTGKVYQLLSPTDIPLVGRAKETQTMLHVLESAKQGEGATWSLEGPVGIGKTRLVKWLEDRAREQGFSVQTAICLKESMAPLFPWQQVFRRNLAKDRRAEAAKGSQIASGKLEASVLLLEVEHGSGLGKWLEGRERQGDVLFVSRDKPTTIRERHPGLPKETEMLWLTRVDGEGRVHPANIDLLGERLEIHLRNAAGNIVALEGLEYLVSQSNFSAVYNFLQFLRDVAQEVDGHVVVSFRPSAFEKREVALLETLGEVSREVAKPQEQPPEEGEASIANTMLKFLDSVEAMAGKQPLLVVLEDIQWADPPSMKVLQFLARNIKQLQVAMVATVRTEMGGRPAIGSADGQENPMTQIVENMVDEGCLERLELTGLKGEDRLQVAEKVVGAPIVVHDGSAEFDAFLQHTDGNPYLIISAMQMLAEEGRITRKGHLALVDLARGGRHGGEAFAFPMSVSQAAGERVRSLAQGDQSIIMAAAVAGQDFQATAVAKAVGLSPETVASACRRMEREKGFISHVQGKEDRWFFANPVSLEAAHGLLTPEKHKQYALLLARWWAENLPDEVETIARLYHEAGESQEGLPWVRKAMEGTLSRGSPDMVLRVHRWLQEMLAQGGVPPEERVREGLLIARRELTGLGKSWPYFTMLEELHDIGAPSPLPDLVECLAIRALSTLNVVQGEDRLTKLLQKYPRDNPEDPMELRIALIMARIEILLQESKYTQIGELADEGLALIGGSGGSLERVSMIIWKAMILAERGDPQSAIPLLEEVNRLKEDADSKHVNPYGIEAWCYSIMGKVATSFALYKTQYDQAKNTNRVEALVAPIYNRGLLEAAYGDPSDARRTLEEARSVVQKFGRTEWIGNLTYLEGEILLAEGKWKETLTILKPIVEEGMGTNLGQDLPQAGIALAESYLRCKEPDKAYMTLKLIEVGEAKVQRLSVPRFYRLKGQIAEAMGHSEEALRFLRRSLGEANDVKNAIEAGLTKVELAKLEAQLDDYEAADRLRSEAKSDIERSELLPGTRPRAIEEALRG